MRIFCALALIVSVVGCGGSGVDVSGSVLFPDSTPLTQGVVALTGEGHTHQGKIATDGSYNVSGLLPGTYKVAITGTTTGGESSFDSTQIDEATGEYVKPPAEFPPEVNLIADKYSDMEISELSIVVPSDDYTLNVTAQ